MFKVHKLYKKEGREEYQVLLEGMESVEPYYLLEYIDIFGEGFENLICFSNTNNNSKSIILMPGYLNSIIIGKEKMGYYDFISPYGYSGPI